MYKPLCEKILYMYRLTKYSKTCVNRPLSRIRKIGSQDQLSLNAGQKYCRMLQGEHSAILSTFIKLPLVFKIFVLPIFERRFTQGLLYSTAVQYVAIICTLVAAIIYMYKIKDLCVTCRNNHIRAQE